LAAVAAHKAEYLTARHRRRRERLAKCGVRAWAAAGCMFGASADSRGVRLGARCCNLAQLSPSRAPLTGGRAKQQQSQQATDQRCRHALATMRRREREWMRFTADHQGVVQPRKCNAGSRVVARGHSSASLRALPVLLTSQPAFCCLVRVFLEAESRKKVQPSIKPQEQTLTVRPTVVVEAGRYCA
jgi:hypothetical protein